MTHTETSWRCDGHPTYIKVVVVAVFKKISKRNEEETTAVFALLTGRAIAVKNKSRKQNSGEEIRKKHKEKGHLISYVMPWAWEYECESKTFSWRFSQYQNSLETYHTVNILQLTATFCDRCCCLIFLGTGHEMELFVLEMFLLCVFCFLRYCINSF